MSSHKKHDETNNNLGGLLNNMDFGEFIKNVDFTQLSSIISSLKSNSEDGDKRKLVDISEDKIKDVMDKLSSIDFNEILNMDSFKNLNEKLKDFNKK
ncbi:MAG: hypothetical protein Q8900_06230 [Bacillota bacterium]|nr:hypothetical protein [Bacillota bacterium]